MRDGGVAGNICGAARGRASSCLGRMDAWLEGLKRNRDEDGSSWLEREEASKRTASAWDFPNEERQQAFGEGWERAQQGAFGSGGDSVETFVAGSKRPLLPGEPGDAQEGGFGVLKRCKPELWDAQPDAAAPWPDVESWSGLPNRSVC